jgi:2-dehydro-3-deoxyphosphooctonate aldolase (KDO 8-P synthase)
LHPFLTIANLHPEFYETMIKSIPLLKHSSEYNFFIIAGPCVVESEELCFEVAEKVKAISDNLQIPFIFKASYKKANRSRVDSFSTIGELRSLEIIKKVRGKFQIPVLTDIHSVEDADLAACYVDVLQIPAFLCRQTELLIAAAETGKWINIKKGQFLSAESMKYAVEKVRRAGNENIMLTERGSMFGYHDLIVDYRSIPEMQKNKVAVVLDVTHSLQQPNQNSGITGGKPDLIATMAKAGIAAGADGIFIETHPDPSKALSDGANMLKLELLEPLLYQLQKIKRALV